MSRINASRGNRAYRRDARGRFAKTGSVSAESVPTAPGTAGKVVRAVGITAVSLAGAAVVGAAVGTEVYHLNTVKIAADRKSAFEDEQKAADLDRRVANLIEKHRKRQRIASGRAR